MPFYVLKESHSHYLKKGVGLGRGRLFIISGPSGVGKTTLTEKVIRNLSPKINLSRIVTYTTRPPRGKEVNGEDYFFISQETFEEKKESGLFLETAKYSGFWYASPLPNENFFKDSASHVLILDIQGAKSADKKIKDTVFIWIDPPDIQTLQKRLEKRRTENTRDLEKRMAAAVEEIKQAHKSSVFNFFIVNDDLEIVVNQFEMIIEKEILIL
jgi:guanylate kinase